MKDRFSGHSQLYATFRPHYPEALFSYISSLTPGHQRAWDCGTGNGQVACGLAPYFQEVYATDISESQLKFAVKKENIFYSVGSAEHASFPGNFFDLVIVAQAIHWFSFDAFYAEVERTLKPGGVFMVTGYSLLRVNEKVDAIISRFYHDIVGRYWDPERKYVDAGYQTIPFPFSEIKTPSFCMQFEWSLDELCGYLYTWSAVQTFIDDNRFNPLDLILDELKTAWGNPGDIKTVTFPFFTRAGKLPLPS